MNKSKFSNRLINETSPYLLQHAHNPVDWFAWSDEAFEKARKEDKPILVSIGYSACHWCHVMEHESFEDEATAAMMNEHFVSIKVDLEERPDVDQIYMTFVQMTSGHGGYPLNVFLTPDKKPFFGGTYFPPQNRYNMPSFQRILTSVAEAYRERKDEVLTSANDILGEIRNLTSAKTTGENLSLEQLDYSFKSFVKTFDNVNGGFGGAPKFPPPMSLEFLLRYFYRTGNENALSMVEKTCRKMANGGIYDQLGGGFHRYTVDAVWLVPHFEKMLYDNAQLARIYLHVFQITKDEFYKRIAVETLEYVKREMTDARSGGFYTAQDADSEGVEGKFFVWTPEEIEAILGTRDAQIFNFYFDVTEHGNFEEKNILNVKNSLTESAEVLKISEDELKEILALGREKLFGEREKRVEPFRDEKVLTAWNGLMLATFAEASAILESEEYLEIAHRNADFILENLQKDEHLLRTYKDGKAKLNAYLEDYANFADGLIELFQVSGDVKYLKAAKRFAVVLITEFWDEEGGGFFFTANNHEELLVRTKDFYDNATPSGNSAAADALLKLAHLVKDGERYEQFAASVLSSVAPQIRHYPQAFGRSLSALEFYLNPTKEIVVLGERGNELEREVWREFLPNKVVVSAQNADDADFVPLLEARKLLDGEAATAFVCENFTCQKPVATAEDLREQLFSE
ncbi:MAG: thioredoxin domain-containing protein [Acidobacteria bacterium]|nr:thioredoxin domain-containing protein [Acidobacteriota bacterium]